jgi:hypothetical protein
MSKNSRGQAAIETILLTFVLITFVAAAYQIFQVNQTIYRSLTAVHQQLFERAFERNCSESRADDGCEYSQDPVSEGLGGTTTRVVWSPTEIPEIMIPVVGMFGKQGLANEQPRLWSNRPDAGGEDGCPGLPCKTTRVGAGTYKSTFGAIWLLRKVRPDLGYLAGYAGRAAAKGVVSAIQ